MRMGFITSLFDGWTYEEMMDDVARLGIECVEVACWPKGKAERKYGGVTHIEASISARLRTTRTISTPTPSVGRPSTITSSRPSALLRSSACRRSRRSSAA